MKMQFHSELHHKFYAKYADLLLKFCSQKEIVFAVGLMERQIM